MGQMLVVTLREGIEMFLIVAIAAAYLRKTGRDALLPAVWSGAATAGAASLVLGIWLAEVAVLPVWQVIPGHVLAANNVDRNSKVNGTRYNGFDLLFRARAKGGAFFQGGTSTGRIVTNTCDVADPNGLRFCDQSQSGEPFLTTKKLSGNYPVPKLIG